MKKVYLVQVSAEYENVTLLPYSVGVIAAYARSLETIKENYIFERFLYKRESIEDAINSLEEPYLVGFSNCVWNFEYNKAFAQMLKEKYPFCYVIFGGHNIPLNDSILENLEFIDFLVHGEGEKAFTEILTALLTGDSFSDIPNISYRTADGACCMNEIVPVFDTDFPSPYLTGVFDEIVKSEKTAYLAIFETNRGCPYHCTYCDWQTSKTGIRRFPLERIKAEIEWIAKNKIEYCGSSDSNFGIYERDEMIADYLVEMKKKTGYPKKFQVSCAKDSNMTVYRINKKLNDAHMCKGVTLSFQSLSLVVLEKIGRKNMTLEKFAELMGMYEKAGIPTYSELILGLPGETYKSFCSGIGRLFEASQHTSLIVNNCDLLVNTPLASPESVNKYGIKTVSTPFVKEHCEPFIPEMQEFSTLIVGTNTMDRQMWVKAKLFSLYTQAFHCMGLLRYFDTYLFYEKKVKYEVFYKLLLAFFEESEASFCRDVYVEMKRRLENFAGGGEAMRFVNPRFGNIAWPPEEYLFLELLLRHEEFFADIVPFLLRFGIKEDIYNDLSIYQKNIVKLPGKTGFGITLKYDLDSYFSSISLNSHNPLQKRENILYIDDPKTPADWDAFAREVVWYGRKSGKNTYKNITVKYV